MKVKKFKIKTTCWSCQGKGCKQCLFTGKWIESCYHFTIKDKKGKKFSFDSDNLS